MFNEPTRRVNLAGRNSSSLTSNRSALLEQSRREREHRQSQKERLTAAIRLQSFIRARQQRQRIKVQQRKLFDESIHSTLALYKQAVTGTALPPPSSSSPPPPSPLASLLLCLRRFLFFYSSRLTEDRGRWQLIQQLLTLSLRSNQTHPLLPSQLSSSLHYSSLLLLSHSDRSTWIHQVTLLTSILLSDISEIDTVSDQSVHSSLFLLFQLFTASQWSVYPTVKNVTSPIFSALLSSSSTSLQSLQSSITSAQLTVLHRCVFIQPPPPPPRPLSFSSSFSPLLSSFSSWHAALRSRLLHISEVEDSLASSSSAAMQTASKNAAGLIALLMATPLQLTLSTNLTSSLPPPFASSFVVYILSIPLLSARLQSLGLSALLSKLVDPALIISALSQLIQRIPSGSTAASSSSPSSSLSSSSSSLSSLLLHLLPPSRSFSSWDSSSHSVPRPSLSRASINGNEDESMDENSEDEMEENGQMTVPAAPSSSALWLLGNLVEWHSLLLTDEEQQQKLRVFLHVLEELVVAIPSREFPSSRRIVHPMLNAQLSILSSRNFLDRLIQRLQVGHSDANGRASSALSLSTSSISPHFDVSTICVLIDTLLFKWGSSHDILNTLAFSTNLIRFLWDTLRSTGAVRSVIEQSSSPLSSSQTSDLLSPFSFLSAVVPLFCSCYAHLLPVLTDAEFFGDEMLKGTFHSKLLEGEDAGSPIPLLQQKELVAFLVSLAYRLFWVDEAPLSSSSLLPFNQLQVKARLRSRISNVLTLLRDRQSRRSFTSDATWIMHQLPFSLIEAEMKSNQSSSSSSSSPPSRASRLFSALPFVFPFHDRLRYFYDRVEQNKADIGHSVVFAAGRGIKATIRRTHLLEDGFAALHSLGDQLKGRVSIEFVDANGAREPGVDGGGLFREFVSDAIKAAFAPEWGLFIANDQNDVYPNPDSLLLPVDDATALIDHKHQVLSYYTFIGQMIGKLIFERLQCEPRFASFFLRKLLGHVNTLDDLSSLDTQLHRSLMQLRSFNSQQLEDLQLTFSAPKAVVAGGEAREAIPLIPGGLSIPVTSSNLTRYLHLLSDYKLNRSLHLQSRAFQEGLQSVIPRAWISVFTAEELRLLISGEDSVDVKDLRFNTVYGSGYSVDHEVIKWFWDIVECMTKTELSCLLRFVTGIPRQPLQGFSSLQPKFGIQRVDFVSSQQLPTSATCMNLLRLPRYQTKQQLKDRLIYAINNGLGFGLT